MNTTQHQKCKKEKVLRLDKKGKRVLTHPDLISFLLALKVAKQYGL